MKPSHSSLARRETVHRRGKPASKSPVPRTGDSVSARKARQEGFRPSLESQEPCTRLGGASQDSSCNAIPQRIRDLSTRPAQPALDCSHDPVRKCRASQQAAGPLSTIGHYSSKSPVEFDEAFRFDVPMASQLAKVREKRELLLKRKASHIAQPAPEVADSPAQLEIDLRCFPNLAKSRKLFPAKDSPAEHLLRPECTNWHMQVKKLGDSAGCTQLPSQPCAPLSRRLSRDRKAAGAVADVRLTGKQPSAVPESASRLPCTSITIQPTEQSSPPHQPEPSFKKSLLQLHMNKSDSTNKSHGLTSSTAPSTAFDQAGHGSCPLTRKDYRGATHEEFRHFKLKVSGYRKAQRDLPSKCSPQAIPREAEQPREFFGLSAITLSSQASQHARLSKSLARRVAEKLFIPNFWNQS